MGVGGVGYFLVPREQSERIGVMRVKKKGEWTKRGFPKNLLRAQESGQNVVTGLTTRPRARARARAARARGVAWKEEISASTWVGKPQLQRVFTFPMTPVAESIYAPSDPCFREYLRSQ